MSNSYFEKGTTEFNEFLNITRGLEEIFEAYPNFKKLQQHSINGWLEHILLDVLFDMANVGYALILEKQLISLAEDLKNTKDKNLKITIHKFKYELNIFINENVSQRLVSFK